MEPWETPAKTGLHDEVCPFKTTLWNHEVYNVKVFADDTSPFIVVKNNNEKANVLNNDP